MSLRDDMTKHRIFVQRLAGTELSSITEQLNRLQYVAKIQATAGTTGNILKQTLRDSIKNMSKIAVENMTDIAAYESKFSAKVFNKYFDGTVKAVSADKLEKALVNTNMALNNVKINSHDGVKKLIVDESATKKSLKTAYDQFGKKKADELTQIIKDAQLQKLAIKDTHDLIEQRVSGLFRAQATTLAATAVNYSTNIGKTETIQENNNIIKQEIWVTDLEPGTCGYCEDQNDTIYDQGEAPECPVHFNCNCEVIPYVE